TGRREEAEKIAAWIVSQRQVNGLPEQVQEHLLSFAHYALWVERAGQPAVPLLWSHAMFLVLAAELGIQY
ncbi:glycoside hydrolase family 15 protein, partial [Brevibacillus brevis]